LECWHNNGAKNKKDKNSDEAHLAQDEDNSDLDQVLLMVTTNSDNDMSSW